MDDCEVFYRKNYTDINCININLATYLNYVKSDIGNIVFTDNIEHLKN